MWFAQVEASNLILHPPATRSYDTLRDQLVRRTAVSEQCRLQQLLTAARQPLIRSSANPFYNAFRRMVLASSTSDSMSGQSYGSSEEMQTQHRRLDASRSLVMNSTTCSSSASSDHLPATGLPHFTWSPRRHREIGVLCGDYRAINHITVPDRYRFRLLGVLAFSPRPCVSPNPG